MTARVRRLQGAMDAYKRVPSAEALSLLRDALSMALICHCHPSKSIRPVSPSYIGAIQKWIDSTIVH